MSFDDPSLDELIKHTNNIIENNPISSLKKSVIDRLYPADLLHNEFKTLSKSYTTSYQSPSSPSPFMTNADYIKLFFLIVGIIAFSYLAKYIENHSSKSISIPKSIPEKSPTKSISKPDTVLLKTKPKSL